MRIEHEDANDISDPWIWLCGKANFGSFNCLKKIKYYIPKQFFKNRSNKRFRTRKNIHLKKLG